MAVQTYGDGRVPARRKTNRDIALFKSLITTPSNLGSIAASGTSSTLTLPANARLGLKYSQSLAAARFSLKDNDGAANARSLPNPALVAGEVHQINFIEGRHVIKIVRDAGAVTAGTLTLQAMDAIGVFRTIATVTFT